MAEKTTEKASVFQKIASFFEGVRTEYAKIIFPNGETLRKQTVAVLLVSVVIGVLIFVIDLILKYLLGLIL